MSRRARAILEGVIPFAATGLLFGILYNTLFYPRTPIEYLEAGTIGVLLGVAAGLAEQQAVLRRWLQQRSFLAAVVVRTLAYSLAAASILALVLSVEPATLHQCTYADCVAGYVRSPLFARDLIFTTVFVFGATFCAQVVLLVGARNFGRLLIGRYRRPHEVPAEFMFVDLRGSTTIAEALGHERYSSLLRDFFSDVSHAVHAAGGEVYQYIGDEIVIVWPGTRAAGHWLECFTGMRAAVSAVRAQYERRYGLVPEFKAGVHAGPATVTEVGTLRRAHVYHGDVLNTAARIRAECNDAGFDLLASREALASLEAGSRSGFEPLAPLVLRGKSKPVEVFGLTSSAVRSRSVPATPR